MCEPAHIVKALFGIHPGRTSLGLEGQGKKYKGIILDALDFFFICVIINNVAKFKRW